ncbi:MAG: ROK family protein [Candidatus Firestonebacteria bacterium]
MAGTKKIEYALGVDLGGTNIVAGLVNSKGKVIYREKIPTRAHLGGENILNRIASAISLVLNKTTSDIKKKIKGMGIGTPGLVDHIKGIVREPPNLPGWKEIHLKEWLEKKFKIPTYVANDGNAYGVGEYIFGAGKGADSMVCITLGTGMGGGLILDKKLFVGTYQSAGEVGHIVVEKDGLRCNCGNVGCVERYIGASFIVERTKKLIKSGKKSLITKLVNNDLNKITPKIITDAAKKGDKIAIQIWKETGEYIGTALVSIINLLSPEIIVIGGGVSLAGRFLFTPIRKTVKKRLFKYLAQRVKIVPGKLLDDAGVLGSASLVWHHF